MKRTSHTPPPLPPQFRRFLANWLKCGRRTCPCDAREGRGKPDVGTFCQPWGPGPGVRSPLILPTPSPAAMLPLFSFRKAEPLFLLLPSPSPSSFPPSLLFSFVSSNAASDPLSSFPSPGFYLRISSPPAVPLHPWRPWVYLPRTQTPCATAPLLLLSSTPAQQLRARPLPPQATWACLTGPSPWFPVLLVCPQGQT